MFTDIIADKHIDRQTDRQSCGQTHTPTHTQRQTGTHTQRQTDRQTDMLYHVELVPDTVTREIPTVYTVQQQQNILLYYYCDNRRIVRLAFVTRIFQKFGEVGAKLQNCIYRLSR